MQKKKKFIISHCRCSNIVCVLINVYLTSVNIARKHNNNMQQIDYIYSGK